MTIEQVSPADSSLLMNKLVVAAGVAGSVDWDVGEPALETV
jgi:hypothetical protein